MIKSVVALTFKLNHKITNPRKIINQNYTKNLLKVNVDITRKYTVIISHHIYPDETFICLRKSF